MSPSERADGAATSLSWSIIVTYVGVDVVLIRGAGGALDQDDRRMVGVCKLKERVRGQRRRAVISIGVDLFSRPAVPPPQERLDVSRPGNGTAKQRRLIRSQPVAERVEPSLLDVCTAVAGDKVNEDGQDVVVHILELRKHCLAVPPAVVV